MTYINNLISLIKKYIVITSFGFTDAIQLIIIAVVFYGLIMWFKRTRAWSLFRGILVVVIFALLAQVFNMDVILWIVSKAWSVGIVAIIVIFQPELRRALEELGQRKLFKGFLSLGKGDSDLRISSETVDEVVHAVTAMSKEKVGALIVFQMVIDLAEYERTGIKIDSAITSELLENIFVENTPLHDGGVIIRDDRISAATCYLPLSDNPNLSKKYGTRHRAALGLSEVSDAFIIVVSEETGHISVALRGTLFQDLSESELRNKLISAQRGDSEGISDQYGSESTVNRLIERISRKKAPEKEEANVSDHENKEEGGEADA